jgi:hypothetical protein
MSTSWSTYRIHLKWLQLPYTIERKLPIVDSFQSPRAGLLLTGWVMSRLWISHLKCHFVFFIFGDLRWEENTRLVTAPTIVSSRILIDEPFPGTDCNNNCTPHTNTVIFMTLGDLSIRHTTAVPFRPLHIWWRNQRQFEHIYWIKLLLCE